MVKANRDEFSDQVKRIIAGRVNYRCANPTCGASTSGPTEDPTKHLNIGVAAHITAAAPQGPRYDPALSPEERRSPENGIWLCQNCGKLNDNDPNRFSVDLLRHWKETAEANALESIGRRSPFDRHGEPQLVVHIPYNQGALSSSSVIFTSEIIENIRRLFPEYFREPERTQLLSHGAGRLGRSYIIIGLSSSFDRDWNILFFVEEELGWNLVAETMLENQKGYVPEVRYVPGTPGALVLTHVAGYGTGILRRTTSWYRVKQHALVPLLSYPCYFHVAGWEMPFSRVLTVIPVEIPATLSPGEVLRLQFEIKYAMFDPNYSDDNNDELFTLTENLSLEWNEMAQMFAPKTAADDFARIEDYWNENTDQFIRRNRPHLQRLLQVGTKRQRQFIADHLR